MDSLRLLSENERLVSKLYTIYAEKFPEVKEFWLQKAAEENVHAELLESVRLIKQETPSFFQEDRFSIEAIELTMSFVKDLIQKAENSTLINALSMARDIEHSLIERYFFKVIPSDSPTIKNAFAKIEQDTKRHREEIQELWLKYAIK
ncbi:MAG: hypothetical protein V1830_00535 [Candidatus Omnitrophota bacterium]